jgi:hypothetical protein
MSRSTTSLSRALALVVLCLSVSRVAHAQGMGGPAPPLPLAVDLKKVPAGSWAEYSMTMGQMPPMKSRMALVAKGPTTNTIEMTMEGGMMAMAGKLTLQTVVAADQKAPEPIKKTLMQIGENDPMDLPVNPNQQQQFKKPDPKSLVKEETIKVPAGTFKTKHYRDKTPAGDTSDFWISTDVPPFGLVKVVVDQKSSPMVKGPVVIELTATGKDAKMRITKPAKPFDQTALMGQMMGGKPPGGAPPPSPPPAAPAK